MAGDRLAVPGGTWLANLRHLDRLAVGHRPDWRYRSVAALLLDVGRLFTTAARPTGREHGQQGNCYADCALLAGEAPGLVYAEGLAWFGRHPVEHAWCVDTGNGSVLDPAGPQLAAVYVGVPIVGQAAGQLMADLPGPFTGDGLLLGAWLRHGVPGELLVDVGRPVRTGVAR